MNNNTQTTQGTITVCQFKTWGASLSRLLNKIDFITHFKLSGQEKILIKPNLVEALAPPITTPAPLIGALIDYIREKSTHTKIIIGEGSGATEYNTWYPFKTLGYIKLAAEKKVELIDLNEAALTKRTNNHCQRLPELYLPEIVDDHYLISVPVLKAHTLAGVTLTMKNMMGLVPPSHYQQGGHWKKASFHTAIHHAIFDLNRYRTPDLTILDATIGMQKAHLWGPTCNPPINKLVSSFDPVAIDSYGTTLLGFHWQNIRHIQMAHNKLGIAAPLSVQ